MMGNMNYLVIGHPLLNSKSETLNSKQIQIPKFKCLKRGFVFLSFGFKDCLGFQQAVARC